MTKIKLLIFFCGKADSHYKGDTAVPGWWLCSGARLWRWTECILAWPQHWDISHCASWHIPCGK